MNTRLFLKYSPLFVSAALFIALALTPVLTLAAELRAGREASLGGDEILDNDLYLAGGSVASSGEVTGDLTAAGGNVLVTGPVSQDVVVAGGTVTLLGDIGDGVRAAGSTVTIGSRVAGDVIVAGEDIQIVGGEVGRDVVAFGRFLRIDSPVAGDVRFRGGALYINAPVSGSVEIDADTVTLGSSAVISGDFFYRAREEAVIEDGALVSGAVRYTPHGTRQLGIRSAFLGLFALFAIAKLLMVATGALVLGLFFRRQGAELVKNACADPLATLGRGLVFLIILPIASILLLLTVAGVPLGLLGLLAFAAGLILGALLAPVFLGSMLYQWTTKSSGYEVSWKTILLGVAVFFLIGFAPFFGWAIQFGFLLLALGSMAKIRWGAIKKKR